MIYLSMLSKSCLYGRSPYYRSNNIKNIIRCCTQGVHQKNKRRPNEILSEQFPGYKVVYKLPHIKYAAYLNIIKWQQTICSAIAVPVVGGLYAADLISSETGITVIAVGGQTLMLSTVFVVTSICLTTGFINNSLKLLIIRFSLAKVKAMENLTGIGFLLTIWLHSIAIMCNNFVGFVYMKEDDQQVIISYVNYWGKRVDLKTTLDNITPISGASSNPWNKLYRVIRLKSPKLNLKITVEYGEIAAVEDFYDIFGDF